MRQTRAITHLKWLVGPFLVLLAASFLYHDLPAWASYVAAPQRQTVPMTPPPTWTPVVDLGVPVPTQPPPEPKPPEQATPVPEADPWMWLGVEPTIVGPGSEVALRLELENVGGAPLEGAILVLAEPALLRFVNVRASLGEVQAGASPPNWEAGTIQAGAGGVLEISAVVASDALPDNTIPLSATLTWADGQETSNEIVLVLPWALLP